MTQFPDLSTSLGNPPALSVMAAEASSPYFDNKGGNASVLDVADTYARRDEGQKRLSCAHRS